MWQSHWASVWPESRLMQIHIPTSSLITSNSFLSVLSVLALFFSPFCSHLYMQIDSCKNIYGFYQATFQYFKSAKVTVCYGKLTWKGNKVSSSWSSQTGWGGPLWGCKSTAVRVSGQTFTSRGPLCIKEPRCQFILTTLDVDGCRLWTESNAFKSCLKESIYEMNACGCQHDVVITSGKLETVLLWTIVIKHARKYYSFSQLIKWQKNYISHNPLWQHETDKIQINHQCASFALYFLQ